jgi:hypothetical protein
MTPDEATDLAAKTLAAIDALDYSRLRLDIDQADRERVESDLAGLRDCWSFRWGEYFHDLAPHAERYMDGLRRTAALYGVTP